MHFIERPTIAMRLLYNRKEQRKAANSTQRELSGFEHVEEMLNGPPRRRRGRGRGRERNDEPSQDEEVVSGEAIQSIEVDEVDLFQAFRM